MKLHIVGTANRSLRRAQAEWNIEQEISNDEVWSRCAQSFVKNNNDRIPYFDIRNSLFNIRYSLFQSFFFGLTGRFSDQVSRSPALRFVIDGNPMAAEPGKF
jgi:hypothetical protein